mmetsp:Transcript_21872/g.67857  ORF Transcript_21872/g.67857 Transcript_21872/m.67857 type:complete len:209 (+) Transcript_21872:1426-2052(+)
MAAVNPMGGAPFIVTLALVYLTIVLFQSFSLALGAALSPGRVMTVALLCMTAMFLFTGVFIPLEQTPLPWIGLINPLLYCLQAVTSVAIGWGAPYACNDGVRVGTAYPDVCTGRPGDQISPERALADSGVWSDLRLSVGVMAIYALAFRFLAFRALRARMREQGAAQGHVSALLASLRTTLARARAVHVSKPQAAQPAAVTSPAADRV